MPVQNGEPHAHANPISLTLIDHQLTSVQDLRHCAFNPLCAFSLAFAFSNQVCAFSLIGHGVGPFLSSRSASSWNSFQSCTASVRPSSIQLNSTLSNPIAFFASVPDDVSIAVSAACRAACACIPIFINRRTVARARLG